MWADYWRPLTLVFARQNDRGKRQGSRRAEKEHKGVSTENICRWEFAWKPQSRYAVSLGYRREDIRIIANY